MNAKNYKKYYSGYIIKDYDKSSHKKTLCKGKYFILYLDKPETKKLLVKGIKIKPNNSRTKTEGKEIVIKTRNMENAIKASELITASINLLNGEMLIDEPPLTYFSRRYNLKRLYSLSYLQATMKIACKTSFRKAYSYALFKYNLGISLFPINIKDLDPNYFRYLKSPTSRSDRVKMAYSIILFYSVLEELGLEIRADKNNPSFINKKWNPKVKKELEERLKKHGIDIDKPFPLDLRSTPTKIERKIKNANKLKPIQKVAYARYNVRDSEISLVDAILLLSWMRSKISAHKFSKLVESISIYDVSNASFLARRLLLERLGCWPPQYY